MTIRISTKKEFKQLLHSLKYQPLSATDQSLIDVFKDFVFDYEDGEVLAYGYYIDNKLVGLIRFHEDTVREILVDNGENFTLVTLIDALFVHPAHRGKRIASLLVQYAVSETTTPFILSDPFDTAAQQFFIANGFSFTNPFGDTEEWMLYKQT